MAHDLTQTCWMMDFIGRLHRCVEDVVFPHLDYFFFLGGTGSEEFVTQHSAMMAYFEKKK